MSKLTNFRLKNIVGHF